MVKYSISGSSEHLDVSVGPEQCVYLRLRDELSSVTKTVSDGDGALVNIDYNDEGQIIGIEVVQ